ncbi:PREDICTED: mesoderm posterior protein 1 [Elephantulus edwardii]|uniref:mesoderm posterior protein 1 n=1 Tax=Elephantulus edwardii TaxID=28737 RepID=UPI0003F0E057|nr:PREDICTED: mesoderm posterior protein 1 [Elephantulus edwardii]
MAQPLCPPPSESWMLSAGWGPTLPPPRASDTDYGCSPASSLDSWSSAPASSPLPSPAQPCVRPAPRAPTATAGRRGARCSRLGTGQRQSASEREKLRMRTLARALNELRRFLPPSVAPAGQSLTKIETLRLAIRYISHLSALLGLNEDNLQRRRRRLSDAATPRGCPLCPDGSPAQAQTHAQCLGSPAGPAVPWGPPPASTRSLAAPEPHDPPVLYAETAHHEGPSVGPSPLSPIFPGDVLALLETWVPLSPLEWPPA